MAAILLDTNVLSELMRPQPDPLVQSWFAQRSGDTFYLSAITQAEILLGIELLPAGKRREALATAAAAMFAEDFTGRCLPFDALGAAFYADIVAARRAAGQPVTTEDAQIAAIALAHGYPLATRNTRDFAGIAGLTLLNPWQA
jgi:predicted nucleic acid-binding protein